MDLVLVAGTRPEYLKIAPLFKALKKSELKWALFFTGQHPDIWPSESVADSMNYYSIRLKSYCLSDISNQICSGLSERFSSKRPKAILVQGDTISAEAGARWAFLNKVPLIHLEAGMRSGDLHDPWPEEVLRRSISLYARLHLCPGEFAKNALLAEGFDQDKIKVVGNTLHDIVDEKTVNLKLDRKKQHLVTLHRRRASGDDGIEKIGAILRRRLDIHPDENLLYIPHPNGSLNSWKKFHSDNFEPIGPLNHLDLLKTLLNSSSVITDSGGLQEEARWLGCPVSVIRHSTEWPEGISLGQVRVVGSMGQDLETDLDRVDRKVHSLQRTNKSAGQKAVFEIIEFLKTAKV